MYCEYDIKGIRYIFYNILNKMLYGPRIFRGLASSHILENSFLNYFVRREGKPS